VTSGPVGRSSGATGAAGSTFVLVHGAWHGGWCWERVVRRLRERGHDAIAPTLPGMAERASELRADTGLSCHADAVVEVLRAVHGPVVLVGHSYAGLVARQAADRVPEAVEQIVLVDAWFGPDGCSLFDLAPAWFGAAIRDLAAAGDVPWSIPPPPAELVGVTDPGDRAWLEARLTPHPVASFTEPTRLTGAVEAIPTSAVVVEPSAFPFRELAETAGYPTAVLEAGHDAMVTHPGALTDLLLAGRPSLRS